MENKMTVIAKDGVARIGNDFHVLNDESVLAFETDDFRAFEKYLTESLSGFPGKEINIYFNSEKIIAMPAKICRNTIPVGTCSMKKTNYVGILRAINDKKLSFGDAEKTLRLLRPFLDFQGKKILDFIKNVHIEDIVKIDRTKSNTGDYEYSVQRKKSGKDQWTCPESLTFKIPIYENAVEEEIFTFESYFDYKEVDEGVEMFFSFSCVDFENILASYEREIVTGLLEDFKYPKYWGAAKVEKLSNEWTFKSNPLTNC